MSKAISGFGIGYFIAKLAATASVNASPMSAFDEIAELSDLGDPPSDTVDDIEVTHHKSPGKRKEFLSGLIDGGEVTFTINWVPGDGTDVLLQGLVSSREVKAHRIEWPNAYWWTFGGYIKGFKPATPINDKMSATITIKVTGETAMGVPPSSGGGG